MSHAASNTSANVRNFFAQSTWSDATMWSELTNMLGDRNTNKSAYSSAATEGVAAVVDHGAVLTIPTAVVSMLRTLSMMPAKAEPSEVLAGVVLLASTTKKRTTGDAKRMLWQALSVASESLGAEGEPDPNPVFRTWRYVHQVQDFLMSCTSQSMLYACLEHEGRGIRPLFQTMLMNQDWAGCVATICLCVGRVRMLVEADKLPIFLGLVLGIVSGAESTSETEGGEPVFDAVEHTFLLFYARGREDIALSILAWFIHVTVTRQLPVENLRFDLNHSVQRLEHQRDHVGASAVSAEEKATRGAQDTNLAAILPGGVQISVFSSEELVQMSKKVVHRIRWPARSQIPSTTEVIDGIMSTLESRKHRQSSEPRPTPVSPRKRNRPNMMFFPSPLRKSVARNTRNLIMQHATDEVRTFPPYGPSIPSVILGHDKNDILVTNEWLISDHHSIVWFTCPSMKRKHGVFTRTKLNTDEAKRSVASMQLRKRFGLVTLPTFKIRANADTDGEEEQHYVVMDNPSPHTPPYTWHTTAKGYPVSDSVGLYSFQHNPKKMQTIHVITQLIRFAMWRKLCGVRSSHTVPLFYRKDPFDSSRFLVIDPPPTGFVRDSSGGPKVDPHKPLPKILGVPTSGRSTSSGMGTQQRETCVEHTVTSNIEVSNSIISTCARWRNIIENHMSDEECAVIQSPKACLKYLKDVENKVRSSFK